MIVRRPSPNAIERNDFKGLHQVRAVDMVVSDDGNRVVIRAHRDQDPPPSVAVYLRMQGDPLSDYGKVKAGTVKVMIPPPADGEPLYDEQGVDLTMIRHLLSLTPAERVALGEDFVNEVLAIRAYLTRNEVSRDPPDTDVTPG